MRDKVCVILASQGAVSGAVLHLFTTIMQQQSFEFASCEKYLLLFTQPGTVQCAEAGCVVLSRGFPSCSVAS